LRLCERPDCGKQIKRATNRFCSKACSWGHLQEVQHGRRKELAEQMRKIRARETAEERVRRAQLAREAGVIKWREGMFRADIARLPARMTRLDLYAFATEMYKRGRHAERNYQHAGYGRARQMKETA
jgi:endogenous inhibitor of DNA gyrase (YacG/DUF329 family)